MGEIGLCDLDPNLLQDIKGEEEGALAYHFDDPDATVSNQGFHVVFFPETGRGGIVFVGSGSSGDTSWTDAESPQEVYRRYRNDEMYP